MWKILAVWLAVACMASHGAEVPELPGVGADLKGLMRGAIVSLGALIAAVLTGYFSLRLFVWAVIGPGIHSGFMFRDSAKSQAEDSANKSRGFRDHGWQSSDK